MHSSRSVGELVLELPGAHRARRAPFDPLERLSLGGPDVTPGHQRGHERRLVAPVGVEPRAHAADPLTNAGGWSAHRVELVGPS